MARTQASAATTGEVRLAELVAALSLGVDLGFGQPMEHVLRQCQISLRLAELRGMSDEDRLVVYYTALLVNVGCHSDAHEQAKWFGDDISLRSSKYTYDMRSVRGAAASMRLIGSGNPPLHRFRVGLEFAMRGHRDLDEMIHTHSEIAQSLARQLKLDDAVCEAVGASYERWDGKGWPGRTVRRADSVGGPPDSTRRIHRGRAPRWWDGRGGGACAKAPRIAIRPRTGDVPLCAR